MNLDAEKIKKTFVNEQDTISAPTLKQSSYYDLHFIIRSYPEKEFEGRLETKDLTGVTNYQESQDRPQGDPELEEPNTFYTA